MKIKEGFVLRKILDEAVVVASGEASKSFHGMIKLNDSAADIWQWIEEGKTVEEAATCLAREYGLPEEKAKADTEALVQKMLDEGFFEE